MANSIKKAPSTRARKQSEKLPFFHHKGTGYWAKTINYKRVYFERVADDPDGKKSLAFWNKHGSDLRAGRDIKTDENGTRLKDACNHWLTHKQGLLNSAELARRTFDEYFATCEMLLESIGRERSADDMGPDDFAKFRKDISKRFGPNGINKRIGQVRSIFKHAYESDLIKRPAKFGAGFAKPTAKVMRQARIARGKQHFEASELRAILEAAKPSVQGMVLLGVQAGFGNTDIAELPISAINLKTGWLEWPRTKTATIRRVPLWPETIRAIKAAIDAHKQESEYVFLNARGECLIGSRHGHAVGKMFATAAERAGITDRGFYCLRRTFQTQAEESRDLSAVQAIMGHIPSERDMSARYRQAISDERLRAVVDHVRAWLFPPRKSARKGGAE